MGRVSWLFNSQNPMDRVGDKNYIIIIIKPVPSLLWKPFKADLHYSLYVVVVI